MVKGAVFFDYDGTLCDERSGIMLPTAATVSSINELNKSGYYTFIATGRTKCYIPDTGINFDGYVTTNGSYAEIHGETVLDIIFDKRLLLRLIEAMDKLGIYYALENQDICYKKNEYNRDFENSLELFKIDKSVFVPLTDIQNCRANKLFISYEDEESVNELKRLFGNEIIIGHHRSGKSCDLDIGSKSKADGVKAVIERLGISRDKVYVFGDGDNDYDMMRLAGHAIAMGLHHESLDEVAEFVTRTVVGEGIAYALRHYGLIG